MEIANFHTLQEVVQFLKVDDKKVREMIKVGEIPAYKFGGRYRISEQDLQAYIEKSKIKPLVH